MMKIYSIKYAFSLLVLYGSAAYAQLPTFTEITSPVNGTAGFAPLYEASSSWGDYNNDGLLDLIVTGTGQKTTLYKNNGDNTFSEVENTLPKVQQSATAWLDYNNDGDLDLIISGKTDEGISVSKLFKNSGSAGSFTLEEVTSVALQPMYTGGNNQTTRYISTADYDLDGYVDVLMTGQTDVEGSTTRYFNLYKNMEGSSFELKDDLVSEANFVQMNGGMSAWGDFNNDGYQDILYNGYTNEAPNCRAGIYINNRNGTFTAADVEIDGTIAGELAWKDFNNDGNLDFVITGYSYDTGQAYASLYRNTGDGNFEKLTNANLKVGYQLSLAWGDVNNDGFSDLLFSGYIDSDAKSIIYLNNGDETFTEHEIQPKSRAGSLSLADFDNDGDLDVFILGYGNGPVAALLKNDLGEGMESNAAPPAPTDLAATVFDNTVTLEWAPASDDLTPAEALRYNIYIRKGGEEKAMLLFPADTTTGFLKVTDNVIGLTTGSFEVGDLEDGDYAFGVQAIDNGNHGGSFATGTFTIGETEPTLGMSDLAGESFRIYGSNGDIVIVNNGKGLESIKVYSLNGVQVWKSKRDSYGEISIAGLHSGIYVVTIETDRRLMVKKVALR